MKSTINKKLDGVKTASLLAPLRSPETWGGHFFKDTLDVKAGPQDPDEYARALRASAGRLIYHAHSNVLNGESFVSVSASMLREAALLLDLLHTRLMPDEG